MCLKLVLNLNLFWIKTKTFVQTKKGDFKTKINAFTKWNRFRKKKNYTQGVNGFYITIIGLQKTSANHESWIENHFRPDQFNQFALKWFAIILIFCAIFVHEIDRFWDLSSFCWKRRESTKIGFQSFPC